MEVFLKAYYSDKNPNMGLEKYELSAFEGTKRIFEVPMANGRFRLTGKDSLEISESELQMIEDYLGFKLDSPDGTEYLKNFLIDINTDIEVFNLTNPLDVLKFAVIRAYKGDVAESFEDADARSKPPKYYIARGDNDLDRKITGKLLHSQASGILFNLYTDNSRQLIAIAKYLLPSNSGVGDSAKHAYDKLDKYINNLIDKQTNSLDNCKTFLNTLKIDKEVLYLTADVKECIFMNIIRRDKEGYYYNPASNTRYGKTLDATIEYLSDVKNQEELGTGTSADQPFALRFQLKNKKV